MVASEAVRMSRAQVYGLEMSCRKAASGCASVSRSACERRRMVIVMQTPGAWRKSVAYLFIDGARGGREGRSIWGDTMNLWEILILILILIVLVVGAQRYSVIRGNPV